MFKWKKTYNFEIMCKRRINDNIIKRNLDVFVLTIALPSKMISATQNDRKQY